MSSNGHADANGNGTGTGHVNGFTPASIRPVPQNIDAEQCVIGSVLLDNAALDLPEVARLRPEDFLRVTHVTLWRIIRSMRERGDAVDLVLLAEELQRRGEWDRIGRDDALTDILDRTPTAANAAYYAHIVRAKSMGRAMMAIADEVVSEVGRQDRTVEELLALAGDRFARIEPMEEEEVAEIRPWPKAPADACFHGVAGEIVRLIAPHSETDPMAILGQLLVGWGNMIGRGPHWQVERTLHFTNLFLCIVGESSKARKGTSWDHVRWLLHACDPRWVETRILKGMATGEGFIYHVRDPVILRVKQKSGPFKGMYDDEEVDPGETDKRALWVETEFGSTLAVMNRDGNSLSGKVREAFDSGDLRSSTKNSPLKATKAHASIIGHVTNEELQLRLTRNDAANGYGNRFLWLAAKRSRLLPHGGRIQDVIFTDVMKELAHATENANLAVYLSPIERDDEADELWESVYPRLSTPRPGLLGAVTSRAEALVMRIACHYALLDRARSIGRVHLEAGLAFWAYCDDSARFIFGDSLGDPNAERLLKAIVAAGEQGLTRTAMRRAVFKGHKKAGEILAMLETLARSGLIEQVPSEGSDNRGPFAVSWRAAGQEKKR